MIFYSKLTRKEIAELLRIKVSNVRTHLIILDIGLPDMNGIEIWRQFRARYSGEYPPIIAYTSDGGLHEKRMNASINECAAKPVTISIFLKNYKKHLA